MQNLNLFKTWSSSMAYVLGYLTANSSIFRLKSHKSKKLTNRYRITIQSTKDRDILEFIKNQFDDSKELKIHIRSHNGNQIVYYRFAFSSKVVSSDLMDLGLIPKNPKLQDFPKNMPERFYSDFIRGFFDGDACVSNTSMRIDNSPKNKSCVITSQNPVFLNKINEKLGCKLKPLYKDKQDKYFLRFGAYDDLVKVRNYLYNNDNFKGKRKFNIFYSIKRNYKEINDNYFKTWSQKMAYILGFIVADGCIRHKDYNKGAGYKIIIKLHSKDRNILEFIRNEISPQQKIYDYNEISPNRNAIHCSGLHISSRILVEDLIGLGVIPRKTGKEIIPKDMPLKYFPDFLRGYFDGDGCVTNNPYNNHGNIVIDRGAGLYCANRDFLQAIRDILALSGGSLFRQHKNQGCFALKYGAIKDICKLGEFMYYDNHPFAMKRKRDIFYQIMGKI